MRVLVALASGALLCSRAFAQEDGSSPATALATTSPIVSSASGAVSGAVLIPKLTPIVIQVLAPLGSKLSKTGDTFPIALAQPIVIDGKEAVPAGATGVGEVIFAKKSGGMGAAGELVVTARYRRTAARAAQCAFRRSGQGQLQARQCDHGG